MAQDFELSGNFPNPFNSTTNFRLSVGRSGRYLVTINDLAGRTLGSLYSGQLGPGNHHFQWDGRNQIGIDMPSGMYLIRVSNGAHSSSIKTILLR